MIGRASLLFVVAGCEIWNGPDKVSKLEARVDELTAEVSALSGKPVGVGKTKTADKHDTKPADDAKPVDKAGHDEKPEAHADKSDKSDKPDKPDKPATPPKDVDASEGTIDLGFHPEKKGSVAELAKKAGKDFDKPEDKSEKKPEKPVWAYEGPLGVDSWGKLDDDWKACSKGKQQSPIDITPQAVSSSAIEFRYKPTAAEIVDNGHAGQINVAPGSSIKIDNRTYELVRVELHTPSEHTIAGERFPLEAQLVHKDAEGKLAMIGVLYDTGADSRTLEPFYTKWPAKKAVETKLRKPFDPSALLPTTRTVYRYSGSLTTPPCTEGVVWNVMRRSMSETKPHLDEIAGHYKNARKLQPLGDRKVQ